MQPISDHSQRLEIPGISILPPRSINWFVIPESENGSVFADRQIKFFQKLAGLRPDDPNDARLVVASVFIRDTGQPTTPTPDELLRDFIGDDPTRYVGRMITPRQRLVSLDAALDNTFPATCLRYTQVTEISGQFPQFPDLIGISLKRGLVCAHPQWPQFHVNVIYDQIYPKGQEPLSRDTEADVFLKSLAFTPDRPWGTNP